ncbi:MAG: FkbM family methyltransferase [Fimbriimonadaceae bacterium]|nr:FkbM family methyltransferase [Fimbriimonadaceae bacterium]
MAMASAGLARFILRVRPAALGSALKRLFRIERVEHVTADGTFWVDPASNFGSRMMSGQVYEPAMTEALKRGWKPGGTFIDIGANEGYFSVMAAAALGPKGRIIAVEPQGRLQSVLERNFSLNSLANASVAKVGLGSAEATADLNLFPDTNTGATSFARPVSYQLPTERVRITTLDTLLEELKIDQVDCAKVDVEGFELDLFLGAMQTLADSKVKTFVIELHPRLLHDRGASVNDVRSVLEAAGYHWSEPAEELAIATAP